MLKLQLRRVLSYYKLSTDESKSDLTGKLFQVLSLPHHRLGFDSYLNELKCGLPEELELVM